MNIANFLRTPVLKNICERLFERLNMTSNRESRRHLYQLDEKNLPLHDAHDHFVFSMSQAAFVLHNKRC